MNIAKFTSPDFIIGKILVFGRAVVSAILLLIRKPSKESLRKVALILRVSPIYTMLSSERLSALYDIVQTINNGNVEGVIVECGTWNGGSAAMMAASCRNSKTSTLRRAFWLFDSFQGLPRPGEKDADEEKQSFFHGWNKGDPAKVKKIFEKLRLPIEDVKIIPGWFNETLKQTNILKIAVLHIDADWYDSVKVVLDSLYDKVVSGGIIVIDDYGRWQGAKMAVDDYLKEHDIKNVKLEKIDSSAVFFLKPV